ncbi:NAD(P)/FAD-dependent oxidoreductase [Niabella yanshanensis]|uniref:NAD(P)/FAD-dependent oxidoreductase n=1 Tax=Niabella yanshanensis TaxID=577386 RepID=A0ABZ0W6B3_9BACT|nr:NAD(P)/FAD-dependent oxidoreductase [Niabella yanshanensis]WQD38052.1 NAD(P)/FAD-dependent oxidoreductase [Niabella yanshanensis]
MSVKYDTIVVGSGPNGLAAAITLQQRGHPVLLIEGKGQVGGGLRTSELTLPGFHHDVCSAIHPMAIHSPFLSSLPLADFGLEYIHSAIAAAHPFDGGSAAYVTHSIEDTASALGKDEQVYLDLIGPVIEDWPFIINSILAPLRFPDHPFRLAKFGLKALRSASAIARKFSTRKGKGLWGGMAAHSIQPLTNTSTAAVGLVLSAAAHIKGWPMAKGGSQAVANAMAAYFKHLGGTIQTGRWVQSVEELPQARALVLDVTPAQLLKIAGHRFTSFYRSQLQRYRYGMGVFKLDWALSGPIPFLSEECRKAATIHIGGAFEEIALSESSASSGKMIDKPFVLLAQQSLFDVSRAPGGQHTAWGYCHVPNGSAVDMTDIIEQQVERFAPGFKKLILSRHAMNAQQMEIYNPNYIGGDINGGIMDIRQLYTRPSLSLTPYRTSDRQIYICSSSTPPGGGVHGMCGYHAAQTILKDLF